MTCRRVQPRQPNSDEGRSSRPNPTQFEHTALVFCVGIRLIAALASFEKARFSAVLGGSGRVAQW